MFLNLLGPLEEVPESCIESAEYIIQSIINGKRHVWEENKTVDPHVYAIFANGVEFDISECENFHEKIDEKVGDYPFQTLRGGLPGIGQGLVCVNKHWRNRHYNMHLGAVVASARLKNAKHAVILSNMMHTEKMVEMVELQTTKWISSPDQFRSLLSSSYRNFALGLLATKSRKRRFGSI